MVKLIQWMIKGIIRNEDQKSREMNAAIGHFRQEGYAEVRLSAKAENPALRMYEKTGFKTRTVSMSLNLK